MSQKYDITAYVQTKLLNGGRFTNLHFSKFIPPPPQKKNLTASNWLAVKFHYLLLVPKVHILNTFFSLAINDLTLYP